MESTRATDHNHSSQMLITPLKPALIAGMSQKMPVLVRVQAPDPDPTQQKTRNPYHLALVIDRSGSMHGEPLLEAVRCARYIVEQLAPTDIASIVVFDDRINVLAGAQPVGDRQALHSALAHILAGGSTNLHGGWQAGANSLLGNAKAAAMARVILLSDGNANTGETTDTQTIAALCADAAEHGVTTSTYGLGRDFNEDLMVAMGERGGGNHYYGDTAADLFEPFAEEFDFISNLYARQLRLTLTAPAGVKFTVRSDYPQEAQDGALLVRLPDLPLSAEAWVLVEIEVPAHLAGETANVLLQASVSANMPDGAAVAIPNAALALPAMPPSVWEALLPEPLVVARQTEVDTAQLLERARQLVVTGDWQGIEAVLAEGRTRFAEHPWVIEVLERLAELAKAMDERRFAKESLYSSKKMRNRLAAKQENLNSLCEEAIAPSFLRRKSSQGKAQFEA